MVRPYAYHASRLVFSRAQLLFWLICHVVPFSALPSRSDTNLSTCDAGQFCLDVTPLGGMFASAHRLCYPCGGRLQSGKELLDVPGAREGAYVADQVAISFDAMDATGVHFHRQLLDLENKTGVRQTLPSFCQEGEGLLASDCNDCYMPDTNIYQTRSDVLFGRVAYSSFFDRTLLPRKKPYMILNARCNYRDLVVSLDCGRVQSPCWPCALILLLQPCTKKCARSERVKRCSRPRLRL